MTPHAALALASAAHEGQVDHNGVPYLRHVERVVAGTRKLAPPEISDLCAVAAALHDVVEDTSTTLDDLRAAGVPPEVVRAIDALTHRSGEDYAAAIARAAADPIARWVKLADNLDNSDESRLGVLDDAAASRLRAKYAAVRPALFAATGLSPDSVEVEVAVRPDDLPQPSDDRFRWFDDRQSVDRLVTFRDHLTRARAGDLDASAVVSPLLADIDSPAWRARWLRGAGSAGESAAMSDEERALDPWTDEQTLVRLSSARSSVLRRRVAGNPMLPVDRLRALGSDPRWSVREAAAEVPWAPPDLLVSLVATGPDSTLAIRDAAAATIALIERAGPTTRHAALRALLLHQIAEVIGSWKVTRDRWGQVKAYDGNYCEPSGERRGEEQLVSDVLAYLGEQSHVDAATIESVRSKWVAGEETLFFGQLVMLLRAAPSADAAAWIWTLRPLVDQRVPGGHDGPLGEIAQATRRMFWLP